MNNCSRGGHYRVVRNKTGTAAIETETKQGPANGLNRTLFSEIGDALSATLDAPKTRKRSLFNRICKLWLIRKIIGLFRRLFRSGKVVDSARERRDNMNAKSSSEEQVLRRLNAGRLSNRVTIVTNPLGIKGFIECSGSTRAYGVVSPIDESGQLSRGVGCIIKDMAGNHYAREVLRKQGSNNPFDRVDYGQCDTYRFTSVHRPGLANSGSNNWQTIHNVLIPPASHGEFEKHLENAVLNVFEEAVKHGINRVVSPLLGCGRARGGGTGDQLAQAVFAATRRFELRNPHQKAPDMILVSSLSTPDSQACADFESRWTALVQSDTRSTPHSQTCQPKVSSPSGISSGADAGVAGATEAADVASAASHGKAIDCGNCGETTTKAESRTVKGMVVCPDCVREFANDGVNLARMDERYDAIQYEPFEPVTHPSRHLPGYAGVGTITVQITGRAPENLDGRKLAIPVKSETAYFPDNAAGRELVRLLGILHKHKLIYVIDESRSLVRSENSLLLRADYRNRVFNVTHSTYRTGAKGRSGRRNGKRVAEAPCFFTANGKKIFFSNCTDEELQKYGIHKALGVTFNVHFKTSPAGPYGYQQPDGTIDYDYLGRVASEIQEIAQTRGLQDELCTDKILELLGSGAAREGQG